MTYSSLYILTSIKSSKMNVKVPRVCLVMSRVCLYFISVSSEIEYA